MTRETTRETRDDDARDDARDDAPGARDDATTTTRRIFCRCEGCVACARARERDDARRDENGVRTRGTAVHERRDEDGTRANGDEEAV